VAVDEPIRATRCTPTSPEGCMNNKTRCITHHLWEGLSLQIYEYLSSVTVADVLRGNIAGAGANDSSFEERRAAAE